MGVQCLSIAHRQHRDTDSWQPVSNTANKMEKFKHCMRFGHIPLLIVLQLLFIILFAVFVDYDPVTAVSHKGGQKYSTKWQEGEPEKGKELKNESLGTSNEEGSTLLNGYPMFQDVHVMIFIGFGFLMTFLKKYGLSAVFLNMMISALCIQWTILVSGFLHPHYDHCEHEEEGGHMKREAKKALYNSNCSPNWPWIDINIVTLLNADFATAAVLITFGVVLGTTSPVQLVIMSIIEIVLFNVNEVIGR